MRIAMEPTTPKTLSGINQLPYLKQRQIYLEWIPRALIEMFALHPSLYDQNGNDLIKLNSHPGGSDTEMALYHKHGAEDPVLYGHIIDTLNGHFHILLYTINDPESPRFDIDRMPDGQPTELGALLRNISAEQAALEAGLAPGQVRRGLRLLRPAAETFESWVSRLSHELYFAEPLYYHNAILFERLGFAYTKGKHLMERIQVGFSPGGDLAKKMDGSTPFRSPEGLRSIRLRSWAIHDGILGEPFTNVTMYKMIGKNAGIQTCTDCRW